MSQKDKTENASIEVSELVKLINKQFGAGSILTTTSKSNNPDPLTSGSISMDYVLNGGYGKGRIVEVFGPESGGKTTICLHAVAECQKQGQTAAFIDAEHALDINYAKQLGVNVDDLLISQPDNAEQALDIVEMLVRSNAISLIVIDSVAALVPRAEIEGEMGKQHMGLQARLMSQAMRKLTGAIKHAGCTVIFVNQIRSKIGVIFGCFHYDTLVNFTDGRSLPIGQIVKEKIKGNVYCFNPDTGAIQERPIIDWHNNGKIEKPEDFIHIQTTSIDGKGRFGFTCTPKHKILTNSGWKEAQNLSYGDRLISKYRKTITGSYEMFMRGILVGDSHISIRSKNTGSLRLQDNQNPDYLDWKLDKLSPYLQFTERTIGKGYRYDSNYTYELAKLKKQNSNRNPLYLLNNLHPMGLAIWIMDDGHLDLQSSHQRYSISVKRFKNNKIKLQEITDKLCELGFNCNYRLKDGFISFNKDCSTKIANYIAQWVPPCMQYKLPERYRNQYKEFLLSYNDHFATDEVTITEIRSASPRQMRNRQKFDISVEGNHNYMVGGYQNGVVVHNSPEVTTGGNALKFYASQRLEVRKGKKLGDSEGISGNEIKIKCVKSKLGPPFREAMLTINYGEGIDSNLDLLRAALRSDVVQKNGAWFSYEGDRLGQGENNAARTIASSKRIKEEIILKTKAKLNEQ